MIEKELIELIRERRETFATEECRNQRRVSGPDEYEDWDINEDTKREAFDRALSEILESDAFIALFERIAKKLDDERIAEVAAERRSGFDMVGMVNNLFSLTDYPRHYATLAAETRKLP